MSQKLKSELIEETNELCRGVVDSPARSVERVEKFNNLVQRTTAGIAALHTLVNHEQNKSPTIKRMLQSLDVTGQHLFSFLAISREEIEKIKKKKGE